MFSKDNKIPILHLTDKLKYWGLNQSQADFLTDRNLAPSNVEDAKAYICEFFFKYFEKPDDTLAPNEPLRMLINTRRRGSFSGGKLTRRKKLTMRKKSTRAKRRN